MNRTVTLRSGETIEVQDFTIDDLESIRDWYNSVKGQINWAAFDTMSIEAAGMTLVAKFPRLASKVLSWMAGVKLEKLHVNDALGILRVWLDVNDIEATVRDGADFYKRALGIADTLFSSAKGTANAG